MSVHSLGWLGVRTDRSEETVALYRDVLGLEPFHTDAASMRFRLGDGTDLMRDGDAAWCHFRGPDGNVYEIISGGGDRP